MAKITKIEAVPAVKKKIRVAAYARVSTSSDEQLLSLETQKEHYESFIKANPDMEYAGLYYSRLGIYLYFEKENIDTEHMSSELMLSILSSIAESESRSISENSKWSIKHRYEAGTFIISYPPYGYENVDGKMVIVPEEAEVVKEIFQRTISGQGSYIIAKWLNEAGIPSKRGNEWHSSTVKGIL